MYRTFAAQLKPSRDLFHRDTQFVFHGEPVKPLTFYKGQLDGRCVSVIPYTVCACELTV